MNIAMIGTGNVGGALAKRFAEGGNQVLLGVRDASAFKGSELLKYSKNISVRSITDAAKEAEVIVISVPAQVAAETAKSLGDVSGKVIIDTMNSVMRPPEGFNNTCDAILANCNSADVVKCFNTTGFENLLNPLYNTESIDMFTAGSSERGIQVASELAHAIGFKNVFHFGGNDKFFLIEQFAMCWINLAIFQKHGRNLAFKILRR